MNIRLISILFIVIFVLAGCSAQPSTDNRSSTDNRTAPSSDNGTRKPLSDNRTSGIPSVPTGLTASVSVGTEIGNMAPDFTLKTPDGRDIKLSDFRGKKVFLHFWDIQCPSCANEMPLIQQVWQAHQGSNDLMVLAVNLGGNAEQVSTFMKSYGYTFPALLDSDRVVNRLYDEPCCPGTYLINKSGIIGGKLDGAFRDAAAIEEAVSK